MASAFRVLAKRYRGQEVVGLLTRVMSVPATLAVGECATSSEEDGYTYEKAVYTEAINSLHKSGLYEEADQLYTEGASNGHLSWAVIQSQQTPSTEKRQKQLQLDLHGMSAAVAHSAVRVSLQKEIMVESSSRLPIRQSSSPESNAASWDKSVLIITGRGRRSGERLKPVIRPEVQRMLTEEFYPPLSSASIPKNTGALQVPAHDIQAWLRHQQQQKGIRLLLAADALRDISSGRRIEKALQSSGSSRLKEALRERLKQEGEEGSSEAMGTE